MKIRHYLIALVLATSMPALVGVSPDVYAKERPGASEKKRKSISAKQAANIVKSRLGGKVLKVQSTSGGYRVKLVKPDGRILTVTVDGQSGRIKG